MLHHAALPFGNYLVVVNAMEAITILPYELLVVVNDIVDVIVTKLVLMEGSISSAGMVLVLAVVDFIDYALQVALLVKHL